MNREIIFRAISIEYNKFVFGYLVRDEDITYIRTKDCRYVKVLEYTVGQFTGMYDKTEFDYASVEQRQYAFDRAQEFGTLPGDEWKGIMIFEGDVVKCTEYENIGMREFSGEDLKLFDVKDVTGEIINQYISEIKWEEAGFWIKSSEYYDYFDTGLGCFYGDMIASQPIFDIRVIENIYNKRLK